MHINDYYAIHSQEGRKAFLIERALEAITLLTTLTEEVRGLRSQLAARCPLPEGISSDKVYTDSLVKRPPGRPRKDGTW